MPTTWRSKVNYPLGRGALNAAIDDDDLSVVLQSGQGANFPASGAFTIVIDEEIILIDSRSTDTLTVNASGRGWGGSTAAGHDAGAGVYNYQIKEDFTDLEAAVNALEALIAGSGVTGTLLNTTYTTVNAFGAATTINMGANNATWNLGASTTIVAATSLLFSSPSIAFSNAQGRAWWYNTTGYGSSPSSHFRFYLKNNAGSYVDFGSLWMVPDAYTAGAETGTWKFAAVRAGTYDYQVVKIDAYGSITADGDLYVQGGDIITSATTFNLINTTATTVNAFGAASVALTIGHADAKAAFAGGISIADGKDLAAGTTTGTKIGTGATQKLGLWGVTPVVQPASADQAALTLDVDVTGADTVDKSAINTNFTSIQTLVNQLRSDLVAAGIIKGAA